MTQCGWPVTFSVGIVSFSPPLASVPEMLQAADEAMYVAKRSGKDRLEQREFAA
jgi:PleD family two-component response regulator